MHPAVAHIIAPRSAEVPDVMGFMDNNSSFIEEEDVKAKDQRCLQQTCLMKVTIPAMVLFQRVC